MRIALKFGLLITAVVVAWIVIVRLAMGVGADSKASASAPILFNVAAIVAIFLGMSARKRELNGEMSFKEGLKTGMGISLVYAVSACLFFMIEYVVAGPRLLLSEAGPQNQRGSGDGREAAEPSKVASAGLSTGTILRTFLPPEDMA